VKLINWNLQTSCHPSLKPTTHLSFPELMLPLFHTLMG